jgi:hypothetical protein
MEVPIVEEWEVDLWSVIENTLRRAGGTLATTGSESGTLGGCLTSKGFSAKVKANWGTFARFLESHDERLEKNAFFERRGRTNCNYWGPC